MTYSKFSIRIPLELRELLEKEAVNQSRSLNNQISAILKEHYKTHSPPHASTQKHSPQFHSKANRRRVKTKAEVN